MKALAGRIISVALVLVMVLSLASCGEVKKAEGAVEGMFAALKEGDYESMKKYIDSDTLDSADSDSPIAGNPELIFKTICGRCEHEIISAEKIDASTVSITAKITATDMKPVIAEYFGNIMKYAFSVASQNPPPTDEEQAKKMEELFVESATKEGLETVTNEVTFDVVKTEDGAWKIDANKEFANAVMGGFFDAAEEISKSMSNLD